MLGQCSDNLCSTIGRFLVWRLSIEILYAQSISVSNSFWYFFLCLQKCEGISSWRYYPWTNWYSNTDNGQLKSVTYKKLRNDTILRVTFHSTFAQRYHDKCSEYFIQFGGRDCSQPAPIANTLYIQNYGSATEWHSIPAEVSGFCNATSEGQLLPGNIQVSVHVKQSCSGGDTFTGGLGSGRVTSYNLMEEYCL